MNHIVPQGFYFSQTSRSIWTSQVSNRNWSDEFVLLFQSWWSDCFRFVSIRSIVIVPTDPADITYHSCLKDESVSSSLATTILRYLSVWDRSVQYLFGDRSLGQTDIQNNVHFFLRKIAVSLILKDCVFSWKDFLPVGF